MLKIVVVTLAFALPIASHAEGAQSLFEALKEAAVDKVKERVGIPPNKSLPIGRSKGGHVTAANGVPGETCDNYNLHVAGKERESLLGEGVPNMACAIDPPGPNEVVIGARGYADVGGRPVVAIDFLFRNLLPSKQHGRMAAASVVVAGAFPIEWAAAGNAFDRKDLERSRMSEATTLHDLFTADKTYIFPGWVSFYQYDFETRSFPMDLETVRSALFALDPEEVNKEPNLMLAVYPRFVYPDGKVHHDQVNISRVGPRFNLKVEDEAKARSVREAYMKLGPQRILAGVRTKAVRAYVDTKYMAGTRDFPVVDFVVTGFDFYDRQGKRVDLGF